MKNDLVQFSIALMVLVLGGAAEELLPRVSGVGIPVLLMASVFYASRRSVLSAVLFTVAAGAFEDALSALPMMTSVSFFFLAATAAHKLRESFPVMLVAYPLFLMWLWLWLPATAEGFLVRLFVSVPVGLFAAGVFHLLLAWLDRKGAVDEQ